MGSLSPRSSLLSGKFPVLVLSSLLLLMNENPHFDFFSSVGFGLDVGCGVVLGCVGNFNPNSSSLWRSLVVFSFLLSSDIAKFL